MSSIDPVHCGPTVQPVPRISRNTFFTRDADESGNEAVIALAMYRRRQANQRRTHTLRLHRKRRIFGLTRKIGIGRVLFGCQRALALRK